MLRNGTLAREGRHYLVTCTTYGHAPILFDHADLVSHAIHPRAGRTPYHLMAWAILPDHLHLVIDSRGQRLRDIIDTIKLTFGWFYRIRTGHRGPIWELHFKSRLVSDDWDLKDTIDFVENNAVRHGLVTDSLLYPHSSLHELMQRGGTPTDRTLITTDLAIAN